MQRIPFPIVTAVFLIACVSEPPKPTRIDTAWGPVYVPQCTQTVSYKGNKFTVKGADIPIPQASGPAKIGEMTFDPQVLVQAAVITQILDQHQFGTCQLLPALASISKTKFEQALDQMLKDQAILEQLAVVSLNPTALANWVDAYAPRASIIAKKASDTDQRIAAALDPAINTAPVLVTTPDLDQKNKPTTRSSIAITAPPQLSSETNETPPSPIVPEVVPRAAAANTEVVLLAEGVSKVESENINALKPLTELIERRAEQR